MFQRSQLGIVLATIVVLAACGSDGPSDHAHERTSTDVQNLGTSNLVGTSLPAKTIALTFDDGPGDRAAELSSYLAGRGIHATFFVNGGHIAATSLPNPNGLSPSGNVAQVLSQIAADGHLIANHTTTHRDLVSEVLPTGAAKVVQELAETDTDIAAYLPSSHYLFRAPYGYFDSDVWAALAPSAMNKYVGPIFWDIGGSASKYPAGAADWACWQSQLQGSNGVYFGATTTQCGDAYLNEIYSVGRGIVLMHDPYSSSFGNTVDMVKYIVPILESKGYAFARVDEIPAIRALLPGVVCDPSCASCTPGGLCATCEYGTYLSGGSCRACSSCAPGTCETASCAGSSDATCATCAPGTFTATWGAPSCAACDPGTFAANAGAQSCVACDPGTFAANAGAQSCVACAPGTFAANAGAQSCLACAPGTFAASAGAQSCVACPPGTFAANAAATSCLACPPGTSAVNPGATECVADPPPPPPPPPPDAGSDAGPLPADAGADAASEEPPDAAPLPEDGGDVDPGLVSADSGGGSQSGSSGNQGNAGGDGGGAGCGGCTLTRSSTRNEGNLAIALAGLGWALVRRRRRS